MSGQLTQLEQLILDAGATYLVQLDDVGIRQRIQTGLAVAARGPIAAGVPLIPSEGVFGRASSRLSGGTVNGGGAYYWLERGGAICPTTGLTVVMAMSALRNANPSGSSIVALMSCTQGGGYSMFLTSGGNLFFNTYMSSGYQNVFVGRDQVAGAANLVHFTNDRRYLKIYVNGVLKATTDAGALKTISYGAADIFIGAESGGIGADNSVPLADMDISLFSVSPAPFSDAQIAAQYDAFQLQKKLAGTALLDDGSAADKVVIAEWTGSRKASVIPDVNGAWQASVPAGDYLVTATGPSGYRPISHGPVTAVAP